MTESTDLKPYQCMTEASIKDALIEARGDIFVASQLLGITSIRLHRCVQVSAELLATLDELSRVRGEALAPDVLRKCIDERVTLYRVVGLDTLHELATMSHGDNSALAQVRLAAAARLAGVNAEASVGTEGESVMRELNDAYQKTAKSIKYIRETMVIESGQGERVIEHE